MLHVTRPLLRAIPVFLAPLLAAASEPYALPPGLVAVDAGIGPAQRGAPFLLLGASLALHDSSSRRIELRGRLGVLSTQEPGDPATSETLTYNGLIVIGDVVHAWRFGRLEPWVSAGIARATADLDDPASANGPASTDRRVAPSFGAGARVGVGARTLLSIEGLFTPQRESEMTWLSPTPVIGGASLILSVIYRPGDAVTLTGIQEPSPPAARASPRPRSVDVERGPPPEPPSSPAPQAPPAGHCAPPGQPSFAARSAPAYLCRANPVAGGFSCAMHHVEGRFLDEADCARACRRGEEVCPPPGTGGGAACARCEATCQAPEWLPCTEDEGGTSLPGGGCRIDAGRFGAQRPTVVPTECRGEPAP